MIDKRPAIETEEGFSWVFRGPMVNVDLEPNGTEACPDLTENMMVRAMAGDPGNEFGQLAILQTAHRATEKTPGPLDYVDTETYIRGWQERGARIGHYENGRILWHD